jgi:hypothetical protein
MIDVSCPLFAEPINYLTIKTKTGNGRKTFPVGIAKVQASDGSGFKGPDNSRQPLVKPKLIG